MSAMDCGCWKCVHTVTLPCCQPSSCCVTALRCFLGHSSVWLLSGALLCFLQQCQGPLNATIPASPAADTGKTLLDYIPTALLALFVAARASVLLGVLVKKRRALGVALANRMHIMLW